MEFTKRPISKWLNLLVKCLLSLIAVGVLISVLSLMQLWYDIHPVARKIIDNSPMSDVPSYNSAKISQDNNIYWPQFSGNNHSAIHEAIIDGVQITSQAWNTTAPGRDVIDFYRRQMTARGWQDVTKETLQFQPESRPEEQYLGIYQAAIDADLILRRGDWSMQVATFPNKQAAGQTTVSVCLASTPSLKDFFEKISSAFGENAPQGGEPLDVIQSSGHDVYHITIAAKAEPSAQAFQTALADFGAKGWKPAMALPEEKTPYGYFAWLVRGKQYAALSVAALPQGKGASLTFTEVTPN